MPTILGQLVVEVSGDNTKLKRSFKDSEQLQRAFAAGIKRSQTQFAASSAALRENLFNGTLSPAQFARQGAAAAKAWNDKVLAQIGDLRAAGSLTPKLHTMLVKELRDAGLESGKEFGRALQKGLETAGAALSGAGRKLTMGVTLPVVAGGVGAFKAASDAAEEANAFRVTFGPLADQVQQKLNVLHRTIPVTTTELQQLAGGFGRLLLPMGIAPQKASDMSTKLVELAGDLQSLTNVPFADVVTRLTSGLVGETEAVRRLGANIGEVALRQESLRLGYGKNVTALTSAQKAQAIYNILLRDTKLATGDAANTMDSAANTVRFATREFKELFVVIGNELIPIVTPLIHRFAEFLKTLKDTSSATILFWTKFAVGAAVLGPVLQALGGMMTMLSKLPAIIGGIRTALSVAAGVMSGPVGWIALLVAAAAAALLWWTHLNSVKHKLDEIRDNSKAMTADELRAEIAKREASLTTLRTQLQTAPAARAYGSVGARGVGATRAQAATPRSEVQKQIELETGALDIYKKQLATVTSEQAHNAAITDAQRKAWQDMQDTLAKMTSTPKIVSDKDAATALEQRLSQLTQTRDAMEKIGVTTRVVDRAIVGVWTDATAALKAHGNELDNVGMRLQEIAARAQHAIGLSYKLPGLAEPIRRSPLAELAGLSSTMALSTSALSPGLRAAMPGTLGAFTGPQVAQLPPGPGVGQARLDAAQAVFVDALHSAGNTVKGWAGSLAGMLNPVALVGKIFEQFAATFVPVLEPLNDVFGDLAQVVARDLAPVFKAFEPVLRSLIPVIDAVLRVFAPIVAALAPMLQAFVPILKALFPIIKIGAVIATYLFQAFALGASIFLRAVGNIIIAWGTIIKALAQAIDKLPFVSAKGAINAAQGIIDFGKSLLNASDEFKEASEAMGQAREDIKKVNFDDTTSSVKQLGEAAAETSDVLRNVPNWWKSALAVFDATHARDVAGAGPPSGTGGAAGGRPGTATSPTLPPLTSPVPVPIPAAMPGGAGGGTFTPAPTGAAAQGLAVTIENITITENKRDPRAMLRDIIGEAQRISQATWGTTTRWSEAL